MERIGPSPWEESLTQSEPTPISQFLYEEAVARIGRFGKAVADLEAGKESVCAAKIARSSADTALFRCARSTDCSTHYLDELRKLSKTSRGYVQRLKAVGVAE
ncbi:MAG: hypothetical protein ABIG28_03495 [archaeon]